MVNNNEFIGMELSDSELDEVFGGSPHTGGDNTRGKSAEIKRNIGGVLYMIDGVYSGLYVSPTQTYMTHFEATVVDANDPERKAKLIGSTVRVPYADIYMICK